MFRNLIHKIPETRGEFKKNELPICQRDIRQIAQLNEELAENARFAAQLIRINGGVNPNAVKFVFPDEDVTRSRLDEEALGKVILNLAAWSDVE